MTVEVFAVIDECRGMTKNSMCGWWGKAILMLGKMWPLPVVRVAYVTCD